VRSDAPSRRRASAYARAAISAALLAYVLSHVELDRVRRELPDLGPATMAWLLAALLATCGGLALAARRWQQVLSTMEVPLAFRRSLGMCAAGQFLGSVLPSTIGGDLFRARRLGRSAGNTPAVVASIAIERLSGWLVLPAFALLALAVRPGLLGSRTALAVAVCAGALLLLTAILYLAGHPRVGGRLVGESHVRRFLGEVHDGLRRLRRHPRRSATVVGLAAGMQVAAVAAVGLAGRAMGIGIGPIGWLAVVPLVLIVQVLPLSIGGFGVREGALALFLAPLGVGAGRAIVLGLLMYVLSVTVSLGGVPTFAVAEPASGNDSVGRRR
jgi:uncharacterized protein (TIRG00374 family)